MRVFLALLLVLTSVGAAAANPRSWQHEWPKTDFSKKSVSFDEILSGGPPKDGIPAIDNPKFLPVAKIDNLKDTEPVLGLVVEGKAKAYPLRILMWHEIVNDEIAGVPVSVTFCPLCNTALSFERRHGDQALPDVARDLLVDLAEQEDLAGFEERLFELRLVREGSCDPGLLGHARASFRERD